MKFEFVQTEKKFQFVGERAASASKVLRLDLANTLVMLAGEWDKEPIPLDEAKAQVLACIEQAESEGAKKMEVLRMRANLTNIDSMEELIKYCYNYLLRSSGLAVYKRV